MLNFVIPMVQAYDKVGDPRGDLCMETVKNPCSILQQNDANDWWYVPMYLTDIIISLQLCNSIMYHL